MKNFIWDFDGTLYDTYPVMLQALLKTLHDYQQVLPAEEVYRKIKETSIRQLITELPVPQKKFDETYHRYEALSLTESFPFEATPDVLAALKAAGAQHFILTHRTVESTWQLLKRDGLADFVTEIIGSDSGFPRKPDPTSLEYLTVRYQLDKKKSVMVGDRPLDIKAGENAGIQTIFYNRDGFANPVVPDFEVTSLREILPLAAK